MQSNKKAEHPSQSRRGRRDMPGGRLFSRGSEPPLPRQTSAAERITQRHPRTGHSRQTPHHCRPPGQRRGVEESVSVRAVSGYKPPQKTRRWTRRRRNTKSGNGADRQAMFHQTSQSAVRNTHQVLRLAFGWWFCPSKSCSDR